MAVFSRIPLSQSTDGKPVKVNATAIASGTAIHACSSEANVIDEIWLWATNVDTSTRYLTIGWGGVTDPDNLICKDLPIPPNSPPIPIVAGLTLRNSLQVKAATATTGAVVNITGHVNRISGA